MSDHNGTQRLASLTVSMAYGNETNSNLQLDVVEFPYLIVCLSTVGLLMFLIIPIFVVIVYRRRYTERVPVCSENERAAPLPAELISILKSPKQTYYPYPSYCLPPTVKINFDDVQMTNS